MRARGLVLVGVVLAFAVVGSVSWGAGGVPFPPDPGPWHQLGAAASSKPGKTVRLVRAAVSPIALGVVATSASARPIRLFWWSNCEINADDEMSQENQGSATGAHVVTVYPPSLDDATLCYVSVTASAGGTAVVTTAIFAY
jgi:hypothetical protein